MQNIVIAENLTQIVGNQIIISHKCLSDLIQQGFFTYFRLISYPQDFNFQFSVCYLILALRRTFAVRSKDPPG